MKTILDVEKRNGSHSRRTPLGMGILLLALALILTGPAFAEVCPEATLPKVTIAPSPVYVSGPEPWSAGLTITIDLPADVPSYDTISVKLDDVTIYSGAKSGGGTNICNNRTGGSGTCATGANVNQAVISYAASFTEIRAYPIEVNADKGGTTGDVCETASFSVIMEFVAVEFKAPPAIANEYIKNDPNLSTLSGKRHGCVISKIAQNHAKNSKYGPKGGDGVLYPGTGYDVGAITNDVYDYFLYECTK